nr:hypothetical protein [uncultured Dyadobacter sp.]
MIINEVENKNAASLAKIPAQIAEMPDRVSCINDAPKVGTGLRGVVEIPA